VVIINNKAQSFYLFSILSAEKKMVYLEQLPLSKVTKETQNYEWLKVKCSWAMPTIFVLNKP
jgi:hypothetical protein